MTIPVHIGTQVSQSPCVSGRGVRVRGISGTLTGMESRLRNWMGTALAILLALAILTLWVRGQWVVSAAQLGIYTLAAIWLIGVMIRGYPLRCSILLMPLAGAVIWGCLQIATGQTIYRWVTEIAILDWFTRLVVLFLALQFFDEEPLRRRMLHALVWFGFILSVLASLQRFSAPQKIFWLFETDAAGGMGPFLYHNQYAAFIETILPIALVGALLERGRSRLYTMMAGVMMASVVAAVSRAGVVMLVAETLLVLILCRRQVRLPWRRIGAVAGVTGVFVLIFATTVGWGPLWEKLMRDDPYGKRPELFYSSLEMASDRPWMGFGLGTWATAYPAYARFDDGMFDNQAHNDWVQWAAEGGVPFFILMLVIAGALARPALRSIWGVGLLAVLVHCLVDYHFQQRPSFGYYYFALAGLAIRSASHPQENSNHLEE